MRMSYYTSVLGVFWQEQLSALSLLWPGRRGRVGRCEGSPRVGTAWTKAQKWACTGKGQGSK